MPSNVKLEKQRLAIQQASLLIKHLGKIKPLRIYTELLACFVLASSSFYLMLTNDSYAVQCFSFLIFMIFNYRGLTFIHEVAHLDKQVKGFKFLYNILFGYLNFVPAYTHLPHKKHHSKKDYGTQNDPEYEWWTKKPTLYLFRPLLLAFFYPMFLSLRFGVFPLIYLFCTKEFSKVVYTKASTFVMNMNYIRPFSQNEFAMMKRDDLICSLLFLIKISLMVLSILPWKAFALWYGAMIIICLMNNYRALVAHRYSFEKKSDESATTYYEQVLDSVSIEGNLLTEIWAPLSLRYHSVHHFFPNLPYYDLAKAHAVFKKSLPRSHPYFKTVEKSFYSAFKKLFLTCQANQAKQKKVKEDLLK